MAKRKGTPADRLSRTVSDTEIVVRDHIAAVDAALGERPINRWLAGSRCEGDGGIRSPGNPGRRSLSPTIPGRAAGLAAADGLPLLREPGSGRPEAP
jgi:hypothetical protein